MRGLCRLGVVLLWLVCFPFDAHAQGKPDGLQFVDTNGVTLAYRVVGEGQPLLMLHGFGLNGQIWGSVAQEFPGYQLIIPDLPGHGASTNPSGTFLHRDVAVDMFGLLDHLGVSRFEAVGFSSGALTLLHMATSQPERVDAMVLIGAAPYFPEQARKAFRSYAPDSVTPQMVAQRAARWQGGDLDQTRQLFKEFYEFKDNYRDLNFTPPLLATIRARTLVIAGDRDMFFPVELPVEIYRAVPQSYLWIIPNGGHEPYPTADSGKAHFFSVVRQFLAGNWR